MGKKDLLMTEEEKNAAAIANMATNITSAIATTSLITSIAQWAETRVATKHQENLVKLHNDFITENIKNEQLHQEITRTQDQFDIVKDAVFCEGKTPDKDVVFRMMDSLDRSSEIIAKTRSSKANQNKKKNFKEHILNDSDVEEV